MPEENQEGQVIIVAAGESANLPPTSINIERVVRQVVNEVLEEKLEEHLSKFADRVRAPAGKRLERDAVEATLLAKIVRGPAGKGLETETSKPTTETLTEVEQDIWVQLPPQREFAMNMVLEYEGRAKPTVFADWVEDEE